MQALMSAMTTLRNALIAALQSLLKGKSFIQALLAFWVSPSSLRQTGAGPGSGAPAGHASPPPPPSSEDVRRGTVDAAVSIHKTPLNTIVTATETAPSPSPPPSSRPYSPSSLPISTDDFLQEAERLLLRPVQGDRLSVFARGLQTQFRNRLLTNASCMLPSYNHQLPNGHERGRYLSLDVGGSTLRVALIELRGKRAVAVKNGVNGDDKVGSCSSNSETAILRIQSFKITPAVKKLEGMAFFDWMAVRILDTVRQDDGQDMIHEGPLPVGLAWSFPIEQTSLRGGMLQSMGKGFRAADSLLGRDLGDTIEDACRSHGLTVEVAAIVNDSAAALLSQAYAHEATRFGLILGTGVNIAVHLPVTVIGRAKFGTRDPAWFDEASHVIVNTELGMFGYGLLPVTRWDALLNDGHPKPEFQPLEHMVSGYYLGEVCRFALLEAVATAGLFGGVSPPSLLTPYALDTETLSMIEADESASLETATTIFQRHHPSYVPPTREDMVVVRTLASLIAQRSAAIVAASVYALWALKAETEKRLLEACSVEQKHHAGHARAELAIVQEHTVVAYNGSVIEHYPRYLEQCQGAINELLSSPSPSTNGATRGQQTNGAAAGPNPDQEAKTSAGSIVLVPAGESSLLGAAVALACLGA